jgi:hypothetical protein
MNFSALRESILSGHPILENALERAYWENPWFTPENSRLALQAIAEHLLAPEKLEGWLARYGLPERRVSPRRIGLVMAGNIPLAGFHDWMCVLASGHRAVVKLSEKDRVLLPALREILAESDPEAAQRTEFVEQLKGFDAVIATGSDNTARYFEHYFSKYPHLIRRNRRSVAVLRGDETPDQYRGLGHDLFRYFGLGCRSVTKLYVPRGFDFAPLTESIEHHGDLLLHNKWRNNFDYSFTLLLLNKIPHTVAGPVLLTEDPAVGERIACLQFVRYGDPEEVGAELSSVRERLQCVVGSGPLPHWGETVPFGTAQMPSLDDYADGVDTMELLLGKFATEE